MMSDLQLYIYFGGCVFFIIGCFIYYLKSNKNLSNKQKLIRSRIMNAFFAIAFICVVYSFF